MEKITVVGLNGEPVEKFVLRKREHRGMKQILSASVSTAMKEGTPEGAYAHALGAGVSQMFQRFAKGKSYANQVSEKESVEIGSQTAMLERLQEEKGTARFHGEVAKTGAGEIAMEKFNAAAEKIRRSVAPVGPSR